MSFGSKTITLFVLISFQCLFAFKHSSSKEHYVDCDISFLHKYDKSCSFIETTCNIKELHGIDNDTRLMFTNAKDQNFTEVIIDNSNFPTLSKDIAEQFPLMRHLDISYGRLKTINDFAFQEAKELRVLNLVGNELEEIHYSTFKGADNLERLSLAFNKIKELRYDMFASITELETLKLQGNRLTVLDETTFSALRKLKFLNVALNEITKVHPSIVRKNRQLYHLDLNSNPLNELHLQLSSLTFNIIDITDASLTKLSISHSALVANKSIMIRTLKLYINKFSNMANIHLESDIYVRTLVLFKNSLKILDNTVPNFLVNVTDLDLAKNPSTHVSRSLFEKASNLQKLDMSGTKLTFSAKMFEPLKQLTYLKLERNFLKSIDFEVFAGLSKLEHLSLEENRFSNLDYKKLVEVVPSLRQIDIDLNHFSCDFLVEMMEYLKNNTNLRVFEISGEGIRHGKRTSSYRGINCNTVFPSRFQTLFWEGLIVILVVAAVTTACLTKETLRKWYTHVTYRTMTNNSSSNDVTSTVEEDQGLVTV